MKSIALLAAAVLLVGCFPGHCDGAFRQLRSSGEDSGQEQTKIAASASFTLASDFDFATPDQLLAKSKVSAQSFFVVGPSGRVDADVRRRSPRDVRGQTRSPASLPRRMTLRRRR